MATATKKMFSSNPVRNGAPSIMKKMPGYGKACSSNRPEMMMNKIPETDFTIGDFAEKILRVV